MSELIQQLALEAGLTGYFAAGTEYATIIPVSDEVQKFAELIVRQCGYYADVFEGLGCPDDMDPTDTKPSDFMKQKFGVEE